MTHLDVTHDEEHERFVTTVDGHTAELTYRVEGDRILLLFTYVPPPIEGRGVGSELARTAVEEAARRGLTVVPVCGFVRSWMERHP